MTQSKSNAASPGPVGSNTWQTAISLLVFIHLFALFAAVVGNFGPVSPLRGRLGAVPLLRPYLEFLDMDLAYNYHLVDASEFDAPLAVELSTEGDGKSGPAERVFPDPATPGLRSQRRYNLMLSIADQLADDDLNAGLPLAIGRQALADREVTTGTHRLRMVRHLLVPLDEAQAPIAGNADLNDPARFQTAYEADLTFHHSGLSLIKQEAAAESAAVKTSTRQP